MKAKYFFIENSIKSVERCFLSDINLTYKWLRFFEDKWTDFKKYYPDLLKNWRSNV